MLYYKKIQDNGKTMNQHSITKKRIQDIFNEALENIENGKKPNISGLMKKHGYPESSARNLQVTRSKTWQELINKIDDETLINRLYNIATAKDDKTALAGIQEFMRLKNKYPESNRSNNVNIFMNELDTITDKVPKQRKQVKEATEDKET